MQEAIKAAAGALDKRWGKAKTYADDPDYIPGDREMFITRGGVKKDLAAFRAKLEASGDRRADLFIRKLDELKTRINDRDNDAEPQKFDRELNLIKSDYEAAIKPTVPANLPPAKAQDEPKKPANGVAPSGSFQILPGGHGMNPGGLLN